MSKTTIAEIRDVWVRNTDAEAGVWLAHIDRRTQEILDIYADGDRVPMFETGELLFSVFSYLNWLAHIHFREERHVKEYRHDKGKDMVSFLETTTGWDRDVCAAFWLCIRNPIMHTGRSSSFADYERKATFGAKMFADVHSNLAFDPLQFQPDEYKPSVEEDGYFALPHPMDHKSIVISFYFPGIRRKLDTARQIVVEGIASADDESVLGLSRINRKTLAFRISAAKQDSP